MKNWLKPEISFYYGKINKCSAISSKDFWILAHFFLYICNAESADWGSMCSLFNSRTIQTNSRNGEMRAWTEQAKIGAGGIESQSNKQIWVRAGGRESQSNKQIWVRTGGRESQSNKQIWVRTGGRESRNEKQSRSQQNKTIHNEETLRNDHLGKSRLRKDECVVCLYGESVMISKCVCNKSQVCGLLGIEVRMKISQYSGEGSLWRRRRYGSLIRDNIMFIW